MKRYHYTEADFITKKAAQATLLRLLNPLKPFYSDGCAELELGATSEISCKAFDTGFAVTKQEDCTARSLKGDGMDQMLWPDPNTNLIATKTVIPMVVYEIHEGTQIIETEFCYL